MRAVLRWTAGDLRAHRGQALLVVAFAAAVVMSLVLAGALLESAANPWERIFRASRGAHIWLHVRPGADTSALRALPGVRSVAGPYRTAPATLVRSADRVPLELRAEGPELPAVSRPRLRSGHWLNTRQPDGIVLESSLAHAAWAGAGDSVTVRGVDGASHTLRVIGVADSADQGPYPDWTPGLGWVLPATLAAIEPNPGHTEQAVGLRLADPGATDFTAQQAVTALGGEQVTRVSTWRQVQAAAEGGNRLLGLLLGVFGLAALLAAALAVSSAAGGRVLGQAEDIATLKAIGFTPGQVVLMFLAEHTALALGGIALGAAAADLLGPLLPGSAGEAMAVWQALPGRVNALTAAGGAVVLGIAAATALPAWRAGRVPPGPAVRTARSGTRMSRMARAALLFRLPPALVLGTRDAFHRPVRAALTIVRLAVPMLVITVALGSWATLDGFRQDPQRMGLAAALTARPSGLGGSVTRSLLARAPGISASYPGVDVEALVPGQTMSITLRGVGTAARPYPFALAAGHGIRDVDEAVAGQGLLDALHAQVGQWVRVTAAGTPHILHIVGRSIEPEHNGEVLSVSLDALGGLGGIPRPQYYDLVLRPGAKPAAVRSWLLAASHNRLDVRPVADPADQLGAVRVVVVGLVAVLALIGLAELLTATGAGLRDHTRDLGVLRAMGLTPRQVAAVIVTSTGLLTAAAVVAGTVLGVPIGQWLINLQGRASGVGAGIAQPPGMPALLTTGLAAVAAAVAVSVWPAARAARAPVTAALSRV